MMSENELKMIQENIITYDSLSIYKKKNLHRKVQKHYKSVIKAAFKATNSSHIIKS